MNPDTSSVRFPEEKEDNRVTFCMNELEDEYVGQFICLNDLGLDESESVVEELHV